MNYVHLRKLALQLFIGFLALTALLAVISVLAGAFGKVQWKILATTLTISAASICSMSCAAFIEKRRQPALGMCGIGLSAASAALLITGMWPELRSEVYWKTTATLGILAVASAHTFLLLLPELDRRQRWIQPATAISAAVLALQIIVALWGDIQAEPYYRVLAVVAILLGLQTLVIPILMKLRSGGARGGDRLVLARLQDDLYRDPSGRTYQVKEVAGAPGTQP